jgi:hypothetical protein
MDDIFNLVAALEDINCIRYVLWLIDIKYVRSISYDLLCVKSNGL